MTHDEALALYNAGLKVTVKILCDLSNTIEFQEEQIKALEVKVAKLSKNSSIHTNCLPCMRWGSSYN
ncbi:hypothetical protein BuS5_02339 [Desulfosarcina sp. BuS5]|nr:hypothetical protein BuS5_01784 [Desulfosarcina sp. BuS5]WDN89371.1 hypothetical protein BuS5_02339 [Desulfosarcina sp. BuS5]